MAAAAHEREIDLAVRPTGRITWTARLIVRFCQISFWLTVAAVAFPGFLIWKRSLRGASGAALTFFFQRLGATFIKIGQIISTRPDIFSAAFVAPLTALQDRVPGFRFADVRRAIEEDFGRKLEDIFAEFEPTPVASASVAQVHRAILQDAELPPTLPSRVVAVKVRRPGIVRRAYLDEAILSFGARLLSLVPSFALISPVEAVAQFCDAVNRQLDFTIEAENNRRFRKNFEDDPQIIFPALVDQLCSDRVLTMEFIDGVKLDQIRAIGADPIVIARAGTRLLGKMIFHHGFVHADLHPGNVIYVPGNRVVAVDLGLVGVLGAADRRRFALFNYYAAANLGAEAARWLHEASKSRHVRDYAAFERDVSALVASGYDKPLADVEVAAYVAKLYDILRRHRVRFEATFTVAFIAMAVVEAIGRRLDSELNLTREILPYIEGALALASATPPAGALAAPVPAPAAPTSIAGGRYRIRRLLGEGVRKRVYLARDARLDRDVAIALVRTEGLDAAGLARIDLEARAVARLGDHPRIVPVFDSGAEAGVPYVISQYMGGGTLSARLLRSSEQRLPLDTVLRFADQILQALEHAHAHGVVHRDVKPENVWLTEDGFAKLGDFGLARMPGRGDGDTEGVTVGTALYMAPEQATGRDVDHRSDLYSVGATLYELLTGRPPFEGESVAEVIARHVGTSPEPPSRRNPEIPPALDTLVLKLLAKAPSDRFDGATAVRLALRGLSAGDAEDNSKEAGVQPTVAGVFVGRDAEIARLKKGLEEALAGQGRIFVLVGEPGIGKTRVAELVADYARRRGYRVLTGRSFEGEGAPAFWPWVQILRGHLEGRDAARLEPELGPGAPYVAQILPELRALVPGIVELPAIEGEEARFRLFDAVTSFLKRAAATQPIFLFLDDLHWADKSSLLLLHFMARELAGSRIFVVGSYRDVDVQYGHPLSEILPALRRERTFERILLRGLLEEEVRALVAALAGAGAPGALVRAIHRETEGNPFFVEETLRHLTDEGVVPRAGGLWTRAISVDEMGLPEGVREVVGRRLARLSDGCREILVIASVLGREFDARVLEMVAGVESARVAEALAEARAARIVGSEEESWRSRFSHALIRETLYAELGVAERVRLHRKIADALDVLYADDPGTHLPELSYHFYEASPAGGVDRAIELAVLAAEQANGQLAYDEAATSYARALKALRTKEPQDEGRECELLLGLGSAQWRSGEVGASKRTLRRAAELAERAGRPQELARAALLHSGGMLQPMFAAVNQDMVPFLEKALEVLPAEDGALRAMVMAQLGCALTFSEQQNRSAALIDGGLAMARRVGDKRALATVLWNLWVARWGATTSLADLRAHSAEVLSLLAELGDEPRLWGAELVQGILAAEAGEFEAAALAFANGERIAREVREPTSRWVIEYMCAGWALRAAKPEEAERIVRHVYELSGGENEAALGVFVVQRSVVLWQLGRIEELGELVNKGIERRYSASISLYGAVLAFVAAERGRRNEARQWVESFRIAELHRDTFWLSALVWLTRAVHYLDDPDRARLVYDLLLPCGDRIVSVAGSCYSGSTPSTLGLLATAFSRLDDAVAHFERALLLERGMPILLTRTRYDFARTLARRAAPGDRKRALGLLADAIEGAETYGMKKVLADALALKLELEGAASASVKSSIEAVAASIEEKGIDVGAATAPNGTVTLLFTEMDGFPEMTERLGDAEALRLVQTHNQIIRRALRAHGGATIEEQRDGFLLAFPKATEAVRYAVDVQRAFAAHRAEHVDEPLRVRMGVHTGEPIREGGRFFGKTVILAARIAAHAAGDEILASSIVHGLVESAGGFTLDEGEDVRLDGLSGTHRVYGVVWDPSVPARPRGAREALSAAAEPRAGNVFRREGDFWTIAYQGKSIRLRDAKGLQYIATLIRRQGDEIHAADLVAGGMPTSTNTAAEGLEVASGLGDAGEVLDAKARGDYRARVASLRVERDEALAINDSGRVERIEQEIEFISEELSSAYGLGGRSRRVAAPAERARKAVSSRITESLGRIRKENPELGVHLSNAIRLGLFCRYAPEKNMSWLV